MGPVTRRRKLEARLAPDAQRQLDAMHAAHGTGGVARRLGVSIDQVERLVYGGHATELSVNRVEEALGKWRMRDAG